MVGLIGDKTMKKTFVNKIKNMMMKMMISCEQATFLVDKEQYTELSKKDKFDLNMHLKTCKFCRMYKVESRIINDKLTQVFTYNEEEIKLTDAQKAKMIEKLNLESK